MKIYIKRIVSLILIAGLVFKIVFIPQAYASTINAFSNETYKDLTNQTFNETVIIHKKLMKTKAKTFRYKFKYKNNADMSDASDIINALNELYLSYAYNADVNNYSDVKDHNTYAMIKINAKRYQQDYYQSKQTLEKINQIVLDKDIQNKTDYEKIKIINDSIRQYYSYDYHDYEIIKSNKSVNRNVYTGDTILKSINSKTAICNSYAETFQYFCLKYNIPCKKLIGKEIDHAWNACHIDNEDIYVDTCWNDTTNSQEYLYMDKKKNEQTHGTFYESQEIDAKPVKIIYYKIQYKLAGGKNNGKNYTYYRTSNNSKIFNPKRPGYKFLGWYYKNQRIRTIKDLNKKKINKTTITLQAKWKKK